MNAPEPGRDQRRAMRCKRNCLDVFQQKTLIHQNPNFLWEQRASDEISPSLWEGEV